MTGALFSRIFTTSLTIFAMIFGAGNLIFPTRLGVESCGHVWSGFLGFSLTGILLPLVGLMAIVSFGGDYEAFFARLGRIPGKLFIFISMMIIGPFTVMPRIISLAYVLLLPQFPCLPLWLFSLLFAIIAFLIAYRMNRVLDIIGKFLSPIKVVSLACIVLLGLWGAQAMVVTPLDVWGFFSHAMADGYQTLDLLAMIFFGSIIVRLLSQYANKSEHMTLKRAVAITASSGIIAGILLGIIYLGMIYLGALYGDGLLGPDMSGREGEIFRQIVLGVSGCYGALLIGLVVFVAGLTTVVSLSTVLGDYVHQVSKKRLSYTWAVAIVLCICALMASLGLTNIVVYSKPLINFFYPLIIVTTVCNLLYKGLGFTWIKLPVFLTALVSAWLAFF